MADFTEIVKWNDAQDLRSNLVYGLNVPTLSNLEVQSKGLVVDSAGIFGQTSYLYDFGRGGTITGIRFDGAGQVKFRIKVGNFASDLDFNEFEGTDVDSFPGTTIDTLKYLLDPQAYQISQYGAISITGAQSGTPDIFDAPARLTTQFSMSGTYGVRTTMRLTIDTNDIQNSGEFSFLELDNGVHNVQLQKYHAQIRSKIVDAAGNLLGRDVDNNDIILGEPVTIEVDGALVETTNVLTDGVFGSICDIVSETTIVEEFDNLKVIEEAVDFAEKETLTENCVRILGIRADYSLTGILADLEQGLYYRPKRIGGYYALRFPLVGGRADTFANRILSLNYNSRNMTYEYAEVNDEWRITTLVPIGTHYYYFLVDGRRVLDPNNENVVILAAGDVSVVVTESTQFMEFVYRGKANSVEIATSYNNFEGEEMSVGFDPTEILKVNLDDEVYHNRHRDWHKIEIEFDIPIPIVGIRFVTGVPYDHKQRVRVLLDDTPITRDEWRIKCSPADGSSVGVSECATYSNLLAADANGECLSHFINNTDVITASEDEVVEWEFIQDEPINDREIKLYRKFSFMSRLENMAVYERAHRNLELLLPDGYVTKVTDFLVSDNEVPFRRSRRTLAGPEGEWSIIQTTLQDGENIVDVSQTLDSSLTYGNSIDITKIPIKSFIESLNQSGIALNNTEIACTLAANLSHELDEVLEVVDLGASPDPYGPPPDQRFTRESFTRVSDRLRVVVINIDIIPLGVYYLHLIAQPTNFLLEVYASESDAQNRTNRLGYAESAGYGFQQLPTFVSENPLSTPTGLVEIDAQNIVVCFDENAANTIFRTYPRANV